MKESEDRKLNEAAKLLASAPRLTLDPELVDRTIARAKRPSRRWIAAVPALAAAALFGWLAWFIAQPEALTKEEARARVDEHTTIMRTFAAEAANLETNDLTSLKIEMNALDLTRRTEELQVAIQLVPEAREYADAAVQLLYVLKAENADVQTIRLAARNSLDHIVVTSGIVDFAVTVPDTAPTYAIGRIHLYNGNYDEAGKMFSTYLAANPQGVHRNAARVHLADANTRNGEWEQATLNYYSALTGSPTWGTDIRTIDCFQNACQVVGTTTVNGLPMHTFTNEALGQTLKTESFVEIDKGIQDRILLRNNSDPQFVETLRRVKGLDVNATDNAVQLRARPDLLDRLNDIKRDQP